MGLVIVLPAAAAAPPLPPGLTAGSNEHGASAPFEAILVAASAGASGVQLPPGVALAAALKAVLAGHAGQPEGGPETEIPAEAGDPDDESAALAGAAVLVVDGTPLSIAPVDAVEAAGPSDLEGATARADAVDASVLSPGQSLPAGRAPGDIAPLPDVLPSTPLAPGDAQKTVPAADVSVTEQPGGEPASVVVPRVEAIPPGALSEVSSGPDGVSIEQTFDVVAEEASPVEVAGAGDPAAPGADVPAREGAAVPESVLGEEPAPAPAPGESADQLRPANTSSAADEPADEPPGDSVSRHEPGPAAARARPGPDNEGSDDVARVVRSAGNAKPEGDATPAGPADRPAAPAAIGAITSSAAAAPPAQPAGQAYGVPFREAVAPVPVAQQASQAIVESLEAGGGEVRIQLDPPELGEVTIRVVADGDSVQLVIRAERPEVAHLFRQAQPDLASLLAQRGLDLADVFVGNGRGEGQRSWDGQPESRGEPGADFAGVLAGGGVEHAAALSRHNRVRAAYNPDGALVYRV
ncbi:MAG: hypothetical protein Kow0010_09130 [Dehalococcoidia bacterium]